MIAEEETVRDHGWLIHSKNNDIYNEKRSSNDIYKLIGVK